MINMFLILKCLFIGTLVWCESNEEIQNIAEGVVKEMLVKNLEKDLEEGKGGPSFYWDDLTGTWKGHAEMEFEIDWEFPEEQTKSGRIPSISVCDKCTANQTVTETHQETQVKILFKTKTLEPEIMTDEETEYIFQTVTEKIKEYPLTTVKVFQVTSTNVFVTQTLMGTCTDIFEEITVTAEFVAQEITVTETSYQTEFIVRPMETRIEEGCYEAPITNFFFLIVGNPCAPLAENLCVMEGGEMAILSEENIPKIKEAANKLGMSLGSIIGKVINHGTGISTNEEVHLVEDMSLRERGSRAVVCSKKR